MVPFGLGVWAFLVVEPAWAGGDANPAPEGEDSNDDRDDGTSARDLPAFNERFSSEMIWSEGSVRYMLSVWHDYHL